jgi:hypothetical protein
MSRGRSSSPRLRKDEDMDIDNHSPGRKPDAKVIIVTNLTRNVVESHLKIIFGFYGQITKFDLPLFGKCALQDVASLLNTMTNLNFDSWTKQGQGGSRVFRTILSQKSRLSYGRRAARWCNPQSRALRPPHSFQLSFSHSRWSTTQIQERT